MAAAITRTPVHSGSTTGLEMRPAEPLPNSGRSKIAGQGQHVGRGRLRHPAHRTRERAAYHPGVATTVRPSGPAARPGGLAGLTPSGRAIVPAAWSLYDFANTIFSYAIVSTAIGLWLTDDSRFGQGLGQLVVGHRDRDQRRDQRPGLAAARRAERPRRPAPPVPALLHDPDDRAEHDHRPDAGARRGGPVHARELRLQRGAHLLRRHAVRPSATRSRAASCRASASASGYMGTIFAGRHPAAPRHHRDARPDLLHRRGPVRDLRAADLPGRPRPGRLEDAAHHRGGPQELADPGPGHDRPRADRAGPAPVPDRPVLLQRRGQHARRRDERGRRQGRRPDPGAVAADLDHADRRRGRRQLRVGLARRPLRPEEDPHRGPVLVDRRPAARRRRRSA